MMKPWPSSKKPFTFLNSRVRAGCVVGILLLGGCTVDESIAPPRPPLENKARFLDKNRLTQRVEIDTKTAEVRRMVFGQAVIRPGDVSQIPTYIIAEPGDTLYKIASRTGVAMRDLIEKNRLDPPFTLEPGRVLTLPKPRVHVVLRGEFLQSIALQYEVPLKSLIDLNELKEPYRIFPGQELILPAGALNKPKIQPPKPPLVTPAPAPMASAPLAPEEDEKQETPPPIPVAAPQNEDWAAVQNLIPSLAAAPENAVIAAPTPAILPELKPTLLGARDKSAALEKEPDEAPPGASPAPPAPTAPRFGCPLQGKITSTYGPQGGGLYNDGINIAAPEGTKISAVAPGKVVYVGEQLKGYGQLILIKHAKGWMSAYGHVGKFLVKRGEKIQSGQPVGLVGTTGRVSVPQLHFELREGVKSVDPLPHITCHA